MQRDGIEARTEQALRNLAAILQAAGASTADLVKTTIFYGRLDDLPKINQVYTQHTPDPPPARSAPANVELPGGLLISIDAVAVIPAGGDGKPVTMTVKPSGLRPGRPASRLDHPAVLRAVLAKVIGYGRSRAEAALRLERAVHGARIHSVTTNLSRSSGLARASACTGPVSSTELTDPVASRFVRPVVTWAAHTGGPAYRDVLRCGCRAEAWARTMPLPASAQFGRQFLRHPAPLRAQS